MRGRESAFWSWLPRFLCCWPSEIHQGDQKRFVIGVEVLLLHAQDERQDALLLRKHEREELLNGGGRFPGEHIEPE